jgi:hypothetical protein
MDRGFDGEGHVLALLCLGLVASDLPPFAIHQMAASDLRAVPAEARPWTRYLSLHGIPDADRDSFCTALDLALNGVSIRGDLYRPRRVGGGLLVRLDLRGLGWDRFSREVELDKLDKLGVKLDFKTERDKKYYIDIWESIGYSEPYFVASDQYRRGWLNPKLVDTFEKVAYTRKLVVAAHWLFPRLLLERQDGGFYSQLLVLPPLEKDLERRLGVNSAFVAVDIRATHGAAVPKSASVAYAPREIQFLTSSTGHDQHWYSRTLDFNRVESPEKDVRETPAGKARHDAREILFSLPNGLMGGYLANGKGEQQAFAPQTIAEDQREAVPGRYYSPTKTVVNYAKCADCHLESRGLIGFDDNVVKLINPPRRDTGYLVVDYDPVKAARETARIEEFYRKGLREKVDLYRTSYENRVKELTGQDCLTASRNLLKWYDRYTPVYAAEMVSTATAARETGYPEWAARAMWKAASVQGVGKPMPSLKDYAATVVYRALAPLRGREPGVGYDLDGSHLLQGSNQLGFLAAGESITRESWERNVGIGLSQDSFRWDKIPIYVNPR